MRSFSIRLTPRVLLLVLAYLLAACGVNTTGSAAPTLSPIASATPVAAPTQPAPPTAAAAPATAIPSVATQVQAGAANILIGYHKSGGFAGVNETLTVYTDGKIETSDKSGTASAQASPADLQALQALLSSPEFAALQLPMQPPAADAFIYELTLPGRPKPIVATDAAENPAVLRELIAALEKLKKPAK